MVNVLFFIIVSTFPSADVDDVDREWLRRVLRGTRTNTGTSTAGASHDLTTQESTQLKQRIVDELEPGENVLQALQRLGKARTMPTAPLAEGPGTAMSAGKHRLMLSRQSSMSATAKAAFDQLTEASSLLMEAGEYNIHSISREQLATSIAAPGLLESTSVSDGSFGTATVLLEEAKRSSTDAGRGLQGGARLAASLLAGAEASARRDVDLALGGEHLGSKLGTLTDTEQPLEHHHERNGRPAGMEDAQVEDMFADEDPSPVDGHGQQVHGVACGGETTLHPPGESHITNGGGGEPRPNAAQHAQQEEHAWRARHGPGDGLQGFVLDASSGYLYNSSMGCYYDPATNLFGDAASGRWYRLDVATGQYILAG